MGIDLASGARIVKSQKYIIAMAKSKARKAARASKAMASLEKMSHVVRAGVVARTSVHVVLFSAQTGSRSKPVDLQFAGPSSSFRADPAIQVAIAPVFVLFVAI